MEERSLEYQLGFFRCFPASLLINYYQPTDRRIRASSTNRRKAAFRRTPSTAIFSIGESPSSLLGFLRIFLDDCFTARYFVPCQSSASRSLVRSLRRSNSILEESVIVPRPRSSWSALRKLTTPVELETLRRPNSKNPDRD